MVQFQSLCLTVLSLAVCACCLPTSTEPVTAGSNASFSVVNSTNDDDLIDPRFTVEGLALAQGVLKSDQVYMNVLSYFHTIAEMDYTGTINIPDLIHVNPWRDVAISVTPLGDNLQRRYAMWGIYLAINYIIHHNWKPCTFNLFWVDQMVGRVKFLSLVPPPTIGNGNSTDSDISVIKERSAQSNGMSDGPEEVPGPSPNSGGLSPNSGRIIIASSYYRNAQMLTADGVYGSLMGGMMQAASDGPGRRCKNFGYYELTYSTLLTVQNEGPTGTGTRVFLNSMATQALWKIALWLNDQHRFAEFKSTVKLSGKLVGNIGVVKAQTERMALLA